MDYFAYLLALVTNISFWGYLMIAVLAFLESLAFVGLIVPGSVAVIVGGFLAAHGLLDIGDLFIFAAAGAILGDSVSFYLGRKSVIVFREENKLLRPGLLKRGEYYFRKHGDKSVFWGRFIGWVRPIVPFVAGLFNLDRKIFLFWNILSGLFWAALHIAVGYFFGQVWITIALWSSRGSVLIAILVGLILVFYLISKCPISSKTRIKK